MESTDSDDLLRPSLPGHKQELITAVLNQNSHLWQDVGSISKVHEIIKGFATPDIMLHKVTLLRWKAHEQIAMKRNGDSTTVNNPSKINVTEGNRFEAKGKRKPMRSQKHNFDAGRGIYFPNI
jgi:hypothetical protein